MLDSFQCNKTKFYGGDIIKNNDEIIENVSDKDKIKLEIDRLIDDSIGWDDDYYNGYRQALESVLEYIGKMQKMNEK